MNKLEKATAYQKENTVCGSERPQYHSSAPVGWLNDPTGFSMYNGQIHLFCQHHPYSLEWGSMHWGCAVSADFIRWNHLDVALAPDCPYDSGG